MVMFGYLCVLLVVFCAVIAFSQGSLQTSAQATLEISPQDSPQAPLEGPHQEVYPQEFSPQEAPPQEVSPQKASPQEASPQASHRAPSQPSSYVPLIGYKNGRLMFNLFGYNATVGLGSLITGNPADGGLIAGAETPYGQKAVIGGHGEVGKFGLSGGIFADVNSGFGPKVSAALGGVVSKNNAIGGLYANADSGRGHKYEVSKVAATGGNENKLQQFLNLFSQVPGTT